jgi:hypothetical protein
MCIMEVRPGQHHSTIAQAQAHNVNTVVADLDMFGTLLVARGADGEIVDEVAGLKGELHALQGRLQDLWGTFLARELNHGEAPHPTREGDVRDIVRQMIEQDREHAHKYETR